MIENNDDEFVVCGRYKKILTFCFSFVKIKHPGAKRWDEFKWCVRNRIYFNVTIPVLWLRINFHHVGAKWFVKSIANSGKEFSLADVVKENPAKFIGVKNEDRIIKCLYIANGTA